MGKTKRLKVYLGNLEEPGSQRLLSKIRDNMKLFRSVSCEVVVWTTLSSDSVIRIKQSENYPFEIIVAPEIWTENPSSGVDAHRTDRIELHEADELVTTIEIDSNGESVDLRPLIQSLH